MGKDVPRWTASSNSPACRLAEELGEKGPVNLTDPFYAFPPRREGEEKVAIRQNYPLYWRTCAAFRFSK
jgi:hypothetical protein